LEGDTTVPFLKGFLKFTVLLYYFILFFCQQFVLSVKEALLLFKYFCNANRDEQDLVLHPFSSFELLPVPIHPPSTSASNRETASLL